MQTMETLREHQENITSTLYAAMQGRLTVPVEATRIEEFTVGDESVYAILSDLGSLTGVLLAYDAGEDVFKGKRKDYNVLQDKQPVYQNLLDLLVLPALNVRVYKIKDDIAYFSRRLAMRDSRRRLLRNQGIEASELVGRNLDATVTILRHEGAYLDTEGFVSYMPREEVNYNNPLPARVLRTGDTLKVKVLSVDGNALTVSRKALLPDPWDSLTLSEGVVARAKIMNALPDGFSYVIAFKPGITGLARSANPFIPPVRFSNVAVRVEVLDRNKKIIRGKIVG